MLTVLNHVHIENDNLSFSYMLIHSYCNVYLDGVSTTLPTSLYFHFPNSASPTRRLPPPPTDRPYRTILSICPTIHLSLSLPAQPMPSASRWIRYPKPSHTGGSLPHHTLPIPLARNLITYYSPLYSHTHTHHNNTHNHRTHNHTSQQVGISKVINITMPPFHIYPIHSEIISYIKHETYHTSSPFCFLSP